MNKFLTLVFLGLLLVILRLSTSATHHDQASRRTAPARYAADLPASSNALDSSLSTSRCQLVATQR